MTDDAHLLLVLGIAFHILIISFQQGVEDWCKTFYVMMVSVGGHSLGHTAYEGILVETAHHFLMH